MHFEEMRQENILMHKKTHAKLDFLIELLRSVNDQNMPVNNIEYLKENLKKQILSIEVALEVVRN